MTKEQFKLARKKLGYTQQEWGLFFETQYGNRVSNWERGINPLPRGAERIIKTIPKKEKKL